MIAPLVTLAFLATLWLLVVVGASVLEASGARIAAALKGQSTDQHAFKPAPIRMRGSARVQAPMRASARLRAAA